jgi:ribosome biogenesis GTPase A
MSLDVTLYDTPGLPHPRQLTSLFNNPIDARLLVHTKEISPRVVRLESELTLFLGALLRIDLLPRDNEVKKNVCLFF